MIPRIVQKYFADVAMCIVALSAYFLAVEQEAFEAFFEYSRAHEDWDIDELVLVYAIGAAVLPFLLYRTNKRLRAVLSELTEAEKNAQHVARHDGLTGVFNRRYFYELLDEAIGIASANAVPTVLLIDLDRFKVINDLRGHENGDLVLQEITERIQTCCEGGCSVARLGGDEFAVLIMDNRKFTNATRLARRLLTEIQEPLHIGGWVATVGASIGVCHLRDGETSQSMVRNADQAMYKAKAHGRGRYEFFDKDLGEELQKQALLEAELRNAIAQQEIEPHFQPIVEIASGQVCGFEVLSRWTSPTFGRVPPDEFIQLAEDMGLIGALTWQTMHKSLVLAADWDDDIYIAFNLSPKLFDGDLLENIQWQLAETNIDPRRIEIEITENAVIHNVDEAKMALDAIKDLGISISLDDFGTGFSSLATLSQLPFDKIKIDKSFVSDVEAMPQNAKIVTAILALAQSMNIEVTAEGIETNAELSFLTDRACRQGQGYLFSKAMDAQAVSELFEYGQAAYVRSRSRDAS